MAVDLARLLRPRPFAQVLTAVVTVVHPGTTYTAQQVTVDTGGGVCERVPTLAAYTGAAVGDVVLLLLADRRAFVLGKFSHPVATTPLPPTPADPTTGTNTFNAVTAATAKAGIAGGPWRKDRTDVVQGPDPADGNANTGVWCYADIPAGTLAGATIVAAQVWLSRSPAAPGTPIDAGLILHDLPAPGAAAPTVLDSTTVPGIAPGFAGWVDIPTDWAADICDPASPARGVGVFTPDPANFGAFASLLADAQTGALAITWSR